MKRIGAICRCDHTGLGVQSKEFFDHIKCKALVVDVSLVNVHSRQNHDWYPGQQVVYYVRNQRFDLEVVKHFLISIDVLFIFETPYDYSILSLAQMMGIKIILQLNYEFLEYPSSLPAPDLFLAPSWWHWNDIPEPKKFLQVPVNVKKFIPQHKERTFVHVMGKPAIHDRNGTFVFFECLQYVKSEITVVVKSQSRISLPKVKSNINFECDFSFRENYWENYDGGVLVMPRKYGGQSLVMHEAIAAEMPVIATDISPNHEWLPKEWLVPARKTISFKAKKTIDVYEADVKRLAAKIDEFCNRDYLTRSINATRIIKSTLSWETLLPEYEKLLS